MELKRQASMLKKEIGWDGKHFTDLQWLKEEQKRDLKKKAKKQKQV